MIRETIFGRNHKKMSTGAYIGRCTDGGSYYLFQTNTSIKIVGSFSVWVIGGGGGGNTYIRNTPSTDGGVHPVGPNGTGASGGGDSGYVNYTNAYSPNVITLNFFIGIGGSSGLSGGGTAVISTDIPINIGAGGGSKGKLEGVDSGGGIVWYGGAGYTNNNYVFPVNPDMSTKGSYIISGCGSFSNTNFGGGGGAGGYTTNTTTIPALPQKTYPIGSGGKGGYFAHVGPYPYYQFFIQQPGQKGSNGGVIIKVF